MIKPAILVTGKNGQLGKELQALASSFTQYEFIFTDRSELDITNQNEINTFFEKYIPAFCINAAAYTAVDKAETEKELAMRVNAEAAGHLALACTKYAAKFIHVSTDYVYDGSATTPYTENHPVNPVNYYGLTKRMGEELALANHPSSVIIRTSWVYSSYGNNFVKTMLRLMADRDSINVVSDQFGSPTYAADLAAAILHIIAAPTTSPGIYHYSNEGIINWYDFAVEIKKLSGSTCNVSPIPTSAYPTPAKRPAYSVLNKDKIQNTFHIQLINWQDSLMQCFLLLRG